MIVCQPKSAYQAKKDDDWTALRSELGALSSIPEAGAWRKDFLSNRARLLPDSWPGLIMEAWLDRVTELQAADAERSMDRTVGQIARGER